MPKPKSGKPVVGIDAVRQCYLDRCAEPDVDLDAEQKIVFDAWREIAGKRAMQAQSPWTNPTPTPAAVDDLLLGDSQQASTDGAVYDLTRAGAHLRHRP